MHETLLQFVETGLTYMLSDQCVTVLLCTYVTTLQAQNVNLTLK